jgi:DNA-binding MarR family transcriptional regulator
MAARSPYFKELPRYEALREEAQRNPNIDPLGILAFLNLAKTGTELLAYDTQILRSQSTSPGRFIVLVILKHRVDNPPTAAELADSTGVTRATITGLLDGLEKEKYVHRTIDLKDRRSVRVVLTDSGREFIKSIMPCYGSWMKWVVESLSEDERTDLISILGKVQNRISNWQNTNTHIACGQS